MARPLKKLPMVGPQLIALEYRLQDPSGKIHIALGREAATKLAFELMDTYGEGTCFLLPVVRTADESRAMNGAKHQQLEGAA